MLFSFTWLFWVYDYFCSNEEDSHGKSSKRRRVAWVAPRQTRPQSTIADFDIVDDDGPRVVEVKVPQQRVNVRGRGPSLADALGWAPMRVSHEMAPPLPPLPQLARSSQNVDEIDEEERVDEGANDVRRRDDSPRDELDAIFSSLW